MKIIAFALLFQLLAGTTTLWKVEKLTPTESAVLKKSQAALDAAIAEHAKVQDEIAKAHGLSEQSYMEWRTWYEFRDDFVMGYRWTYGGAKP